MNNRLKYHLTISLFFLILGLSSCAQNQKEKKTPREEINDAVAVEAEATPQFNRLKFDSIVASLITKPFPVIDTTNFINSEEENLFTKEEVTALKLESIYPDFYKTTHNFRAKPRYKIDLSKDFYSIVVTVFKGDNELESVFINYDLNGTIIDHVVISYDEIAEGWSRIVSTISKNYLRVDHIFWDEIKEVTQFTYSIHSDGVIEELASENLKESIENYELINSILIELKLEWAQIEIGYLIFGELSQVTKETLVIIPEIAEEEDDLLQLNTHMVLVNARTGAITHQLVETYNENGWQSDAIAIEAIEIDPLVYRVNEPEKAFGIVIKYRNQSQPNPYAEEVISLYIKDKNTLKKILDHYKLYESTGIVNVNSCYAEYTITRNTLSFDTLKTNDYFNILVENTSIQELFQEDENGDCNPTETLLSNQNKVLTYNGNVYEEATLTHQEANRQNESKTIHYLEYQPEKLQNLRFPKFSVEQAFQVNTVKVVSGYYTPVDGQIAPPDNEKDWGDRLLLLDKNNILIFQSKGIGDAYLYEPHFYKSPQSNKTIIICQLAFEYPFGGDVFILENGNIKHIGMLDIEGTEEGKFLTDIVEIQEKEDRIEFTLNSDKLILNPGGQNERIIDNKNVKYIFENNRLYLEK